MQTICCTLRGKAVVLMGKNTMMRKAMPGHLEKHSALEKSKPSLLTHLPLLRWQHQLQLRLPKKKSRSLRNQMTTWALGCLTKITISIKCQILSLCIIPVTDVTHPKELIRSSICE